MKQQKILKKQTNIDFCFIYFYSINLRMYTFRHSNDLLKKIMYLKKTVKSDSIFYTYIFFQL